MIATLFYNPMDLHSGAQFWLLGPLMLAVAIVYKSVRTNNLSRLPLEILQTVGYMVAGLVALCAALWAIQAYWL